MDTIKAEIRKSDSVLTRVARSGEYMIYRRLWHGGRWNEYTTYELIRPVRRKGAYCYPASSEFGCYGWNYATLEEAERAMEEKLSVVAGR